MNLDTNRAEHTCAPSPLSEIQIDPSSPLSSHSDGMRPGHNRPRLLVFFLLAGVILVAYSNSFRADFVQDSRSIVLEDPRLRAVSAENIHQILSENYWWPKGESGLYRPLTTLSYLFNYSILGNEENAAGYHSINLLLHWCNSLLVYFLARRLFRQTQTALATAALWALHPVCTEAVVNVVGRADELAALGVLATILLYSRSTTSYGWRKAASLVGMTATSAIGIFSKENAAVVFVLLPLYDLSFRIVGPRGRRVGNAFACLARSSRGYVALIPSLVAFGWARTAMFRKSRPVQMPFVDNPILGADFITGRMTAIKVFGSSLWLLLWPRNLSCDYSFNQIPLVNWRMNRPEDWQGLAGMAALFALLALAVACWRLNRAVFFWLIFTFLSILPTSNLVIPIGSIMAERFLYLPSIGLIACLVVAIQAGVKNCRLPASSIPILVAAVALAWGVRTFERTGDWATEEVLWTQALAVSPNSFKPHTSLAQIWYAQEGSSQRVLHEAERAIAILDDLPNTLNATMPYRDLGFYYLSKGEALAQRNADGSLAVPSEESRQWYAKALGVLQHGTAIDAAFNTTARQALAAREKNSRFLPTFGNAQLYADLGVAYLRLNEPSDAVAAYLHQLRITPSNPAVYRSLAGAYLKLGSTQAAAASLWGAFVLGGAAETTPYLLRFYNDLYPQSCATYFHEGHEFLNTDCALAHAHLCSAIQNVMAAHSDAGQFSRARELEDVSVSRGCAASPGTH
jgi:tetratricopeptide (TPR) repeat protein